MRCSDSMKPWGASRMTEQRSSREQPLQLIYFGEGVQRGPGIGDSRSAVDGCGKSRVMVQRQW